MRKLISATDIEQYHIQGIKHIDVEPNTIVTLLAKELATEYGIYFQEKTPQVQSEISTELLVSLLREILQEGLTPNFECKKDPSGVVLIKGNSVKINQAKIDSFGNTVQYQKLIDASMTSLEAGFWQIERINFVQTNSYDSIHYIVDGIVDICINNVIYTGYSNDVLFIPKNTEVTWKSNQYTRLFYVSALID